MKKCVIKLHQFYLDDVIRGEMFNLVVGKYDKRMVALLIKFFENSILVFFKIPSWKFSKLCIRFIRNEGMHEIQIWEYFHLKIYQIFSEPVSNPKLKDFSNFLKLLMNIFFECCLGIFKVLFHRYFLSQNFLKFFQIFQNLTKSFENCFNIVLRFLICQFSNFFNFTSKFFKVFCYHVWYQHFPLKTYVEHFS